MQSALPRSPPRTPSPSQSEHRPSEIATEATTTTAATAAAQSTALTTPDSSPAADHGDESFPALSTTAAHVALFFRKRRRGDSNAPRPEKLQIALDDLRAALLYLRRHDTATWLHIWDKERWEYEVETRTLHLRMPTRFHESLTSLLVDGIERRVQEAVAENEKARDLWARVTNVGSATVRYDECHAEELVTAGGDDSPDASWAFDRDRPAAFVLEVAWSQEARHLRQKCERYIERSRGGVRTVLAIKAEYAEHAINTPEAKIRLYRYSLHDDGSCSVEQPHPPKLVTDSDAAIILRLADFIPYARTLDSEEYGDISDEIGDITLPADFLASCVENAFRAHRRPSPKPLPEAMRNATFRKRRRSELEEEEESEQLPSVVNSSFESGNGSDTSYKPARTPA